MRFLADENFNGKLLVALRTRLPELDIIRVQDTDIAAASDPELLQWAASEQRVLLTHDVQTLAGYAYDRVIESLPMSGIIEVKISKTIGAILEDLVLLIEASRPEEFENQVRYIPLS